MTVADVNEVIGGSYTFPEEWYRELPDSEGYDVLRSLGFDDWRTVPQSQLIELVRTEPQWKNEVRWARNELRKRKLLDTSAPRGTWKLTAAGLAAAKSRKPLDDLTDREREIATPKQRKPRPKPTPAAVSPAPTERDRLLARLIQLAEGLPLADLELVVDLTRVVRLRSLTDMPPDG